MTNGPICISVINMKGGVGKTTISALLGRYASQRLGMKVLAIDLDPQSNLSQALMRESYRRFITDKRPSIVELFEGRIPPSRTRPSPSTVSITDVLVSNTRLGGENLELIPSRFGFSDNLISPMKMEPRVLAGVIAQEFQDKDIVIIDCAPTESILTQAAYFASRYVLVPVRPEFFATIGFPLLKDSLDLFRSHNATHSIDVAGVVINNWTYHYSGNRGGPERAMSLRDIRTEAKKNDWFIFRNQIPHSRGFPKMMRGNFSHLGDALLYTHFAEEFFGRILEEES